jgi:enoyl-CoA hydratase
MRMVDRGIYLEIKDNIGIVTIDRPDRLNAFNSFMFSELRRVTDELNKNLPRVIVLTGSGEKAFCAGFDVNPDNPMVSSLYDAVNKNNVSAIHESFALLRKSIDGFVALPIPIIAAVNGLAYGGGAELAMRCDMRIMDEDAVICFSEVTLGLMPDWGGGATLAHVLGSAKASDLILSARKVTAKEALELGLINKISYKKQSVKSSVLLAETISKNGPLAVRSALDVIRQSRNMTLHESLALELEKAVSLVEAGECFHGITAFLSKKDPVFPDVE